MMSLLLSSLLFVIGVGLLGGALFGRIRSRRLILLVLALFAWGVAGCMSFTGKEQAEVAPTLAPATPAQSSQTVSTPANPTATPAPESVAPAPTTVAAPAESPLATPTAAPQSTISSPAHALTGQLVFPSERSGNLDLWVMNLEDPQNPIQLTTDPAADVEPRWSPDGSMVLFSSPAGGSYNDIFVINADGSGRRRLLEWPDSHEWGATWSPDGKYIVFTSEKDGNYQIYVMPFAGDAEPINLMQDDFFYTYPDWSADGKWLVFVSNRDGQWDIWKMNIAECLDARLTEGNADDACAPQQLTDYLDDDFFPRWSPDGKKIIFSSRRYSDRDIYVMDADGGNLTRLTNLPGNDSNPIWVMDGQYIIFSRRPQTNWDLFVMDADGSNVWQLTDSPGQDRFGDWKP